MKTWFTFENLYNAYLDCKKRKANTLNHLQFYKDLEINLFALEKELVSRTYRPGRSIAFVVEKPKVREIFAADFRDRVVHHLLYNYLSPYFERIFIHDSWACRKDKGTHQAMFRLKKFAQALERERERERERDGALRQNYYLKMDIKSFFTSIDQEILYSLITKKIKNEEILWLTRTIIFHDCAHDIPPKIQSRPSLFDKLPREKSLFTVRRGKGLPIGNLTSQFFANVYMNELDQFVKHKLKAKYYLRYVDDFIILDRDREKLEYFRSELTKFVEEKLAMTVHPEKQFIRPVSSGIDFVGYVVRPDYVLIRKRVVGDWKIKMEAMTKLSRKKGKQVMASYLAHAIWANSYWLRREMIEKYPRYTHVGKGSLMDDRYLIKFLNSLETI
ncbi:MAG: Reverse transcriptase (RNA-dependent DNA polymerase) [bacterium ADurb.Bin212]|nr:MAG: Reverse transcriptase (RNA-dependent DNA polymerase) [bacterium ADurb.Bin212]